jgi:hypothetical protein
MPEHVEILGQTGSGKSYFETCILLQRLIGRGSHIIVVATKPADETLLKTGWPVVDKYPHDDPRETAIIYWPQAAGLTKAGQAEQAYKIMELLNKLWKPNANVIIVFDEIAYLHNDLNQVESSLRPAWRSTTGRDGGSGSRSWPARSDRRACRVRCTQSPPGRSVSPRRMRKTRSEWRRYWADNAFTCPYCSS